MPLLQGVWERLTIEIDRFRPVTNQANRSQSICLRFQLDCIGKSASTGQLNNDTTDRINTMDNNPPILKMPWARVLLGCILAVSGFFLIVLSSARLLAFLQDNNRQHSVRKSVLKSARPFNEVVVPFTNHKGHIFVTANFDGNPLTCLIDTGVRDVLCQNLPRNGREGGKSFGYNNPLGYESHARYVTLDRVDLGELQLSNPNCVSITANGIGIANTVDGIPINIILGNSVFKAIPSPIW